MDRYVRPSFMFRKARMMERRHCRIDGDSPWAVVEERSDAKPACAECASGLGLGRRTDDGVPVCEDLVR